MSSRRLLFAGVLVVLTAACGSSSSTAPENDSPTTPQGIVAGTVQAVATADGIRIANGTEAAIAFNALEHSVAATALWAPCASTASSCLRVAPGTTRLLPRAEIPGLQASGDVIFWWWHVISTPSGPRPDSIRTILVRF
jgi:hypothetical protein